MAKMRTFKAKLSFKGKDVLYNRSYVEGRIVQMAKFICTNENGEEVPVRLKKWKMKRGIVVEDLLSVTTTEEKFFDFLEKVEDSYPGLISEFTTGKSKK